MTYSYFLAGFYCKIGVWEINIDYIRHVLHTFVEYLEIKVTIYTLISFFLQNTMCRTHFCLITI